MKKLLILVLLTSFHFANAQSTIFGKVLSKDSQEEILFASVLAYNAKDSFAVISDYDGYYTFDSIPNGDYTLTVKYLGHSTTSTTISVANASVELNIEIPEEQIIMESVMVNTYGVQRLASQKIYNYSSVSLKKPAKQSISDMAFTDNGKIKSKEGFIQTKKENTSTFSIDVDKASYSLIRKSILENDLIPQKESVRIEEMINYFSYDYEEPQTDAPFSINTEISNCKWNENAHILQIGLQGQKIDYENIAGSNLVFLVDVSGSMQGQLVLIQKSLEKLVEALNPNDKISIVSYAGNAGLVLPSTSVSEKKVILNAVYNLEAGGSTAGGEGIELAYKIANDNFIKEGNNRVILCTDGDFNVGISSSEELEALITEKKKTNIFLTVCGFGGYNYQDERMEQLANKGNGNYYFIDKIEEAEKVFVEEMRATLFLIAKDVKIQIEFNKDVIESYRLIGYDNRKLANEDFKNDKKDAGELGAGHQVTALYEIILKQDAVMSNLATLNLRYKAPNGSKSNLISEELECNFFNEAETSLNFKLANIVSSFGILLNDLKTKDGIDINDLIYEANLLSKEKSSPELQEFIEIMEAYEELCNKI